MLIGLDVGKKSKMRWRRTGCYNDGGRRLCYSHLRFARCILVLLFLPILFNPPPSLSRELYPPAAARPVAHRGLPFPQPGPTTLSQYGPPGSPPSPPTPVPPVPQPGTASVLPPPPPLPPTRAGPGDRKLCRGTGLVAGRGKRAAIYKLPRFRKGRGVPGMRSWGGVIESKGRQGSPPVAAPTGP